jgi:RHS repeat-associated protein
VLTAGDSTGTIVREYDDLNRVTKYTDAKGNLIQYDYDEVGNLKTLIYPGDKTVSYEYDAANHMKKVTDWAGRITSYDYDVNGRLVKTTKPDGSVQSMEYDAAGQLLQQKDIDKNGTVINQYDFAYDKAGNVTTEQSGTEPTGSAVQNTSMTYGSDNRLATYNGQNAAYDADGNMTTGPLAGAMANFVYDSRNRLVSVGNTSYEYDAENKRIGVTENGSKTSYVINPQARLSQVLIKTDAQGNQTFYVYGLELIGQEDAREKYLTYHFDRRGSTTALTDIGGAVTDRIQYAPYGELVSHTGSTSTPFLFNGRDGVMTDSNGLYFMRARYYNPEVKRFINRDVVQGSISNGLSLNRYAYVNGNPVSYVDPFGLSADSDSGSWLDGLHTALDVLGLVPGLGELFDGLNATIYLAAGDYVNAALSAGSMVPFAGWFSTGAKWAKKGLKGFGGTLKETATRLIKEEAGYINFGATSRFSKAAKEVKGKGVDIELKYKEGWTAAQRAEADAKVKALTEANTVKTHSQRKGTASTRYKKANGQDSVPQGKDVDHIVDLQLGGADDILNMNPLDYSVNRSLGKQIQNIIKGYPVGTVFDKFTIRD